jgi:hypothetical protein
MDLIDRDVLLEEFRSSPKILFYYHEIHKLIKGAPIVDAKPIECGEWVRTKYLYNNKYPATKVNCSRCGAEPLHDEAGFWEESPFCPNCGTPMKG